MNKKNIYTQNNNLKIKPSKKDYEGVLYTPSDYARRKNINEFTENYGYSKNSKKVKKKIKNKKSQYKFFMTLTIASGIIIFFIVLAIAYNSINFDDSPKPTENEFNANLSSEELEQQKNNIDTDNNNTFSPEIPLTVTGVIQNINSTTKLISFMDTDKEEIYNMTVGEFALIKDKYNQDIFFADLSIGDIAEFTFSDTTITAITKSDKCWEIKSVTDIKIDVSKNTISRKNNVYSYNDTTLFLYNGTSFEPKNINSTDTLTLKGIGNKIFTVIVEKSHGILNILNKEHIKDGIIEIDTNIYKNLSDASQFTLSEGIHKVVVKGSNIEALSYDAEIKAGEEFNMNLSELAAEKTGTLTIKANVYDYALYINDNLELSRNNIDLTYGTYNIKIMKEGYVTYETQVKINSPNTVINADVKKEIYMGTLTVTSQPSGAQLYLDGTYVGLTPYTSDVTQGQHSITVKKEGYKDSTLSSIFIENKKEQNFNIILQNKSETLENN